MRDQSIASWLLCDIIKKLVRRSRRARAGDERPEVNGKSGRWSFGTDMRKIHGTSSSARADVRRASRNTTRRNSRFVSSTMRNPNRMNLPRSNKDSSDWPRRRPAPSNWPERVSNAVASFAGDVPCSVIVETRGGSSVVTLTGKPDGLLVTAAADRVPVKDIVCRPEPPPEFAHRVPPDGSQPRGRLPRDARRRYRRRLCGRLLSVERTKSLPTSSS